MKKLLTLLLSAVLAAACCMGLVACGDKDDETRIGEVTFPAVESTEFTQFDDMEISEDFKIGLICLHGETSTYDKNFIDAFKAACATFGLSESQYTIVTDVPESNECYTKAKELAESGCDAIFADSFGHEDYMIQAAREFSDVQFYHATGTKAHTENLPNFHNGFAHIYEGRYLAGVAAGLKLNEMVENGEITDDNKDENGNIRIGYVGAFTYAEVISGLTSFYLGVKSQCANVIMDVQFTGSWYDEAGERTAAETLIDRGCALISQHADSMGAPNACENAGVPNVSYNGSTIDACPDTFIVSSRVDWTYYFKWMIASVGGTADPIPADYAGELGGSLMVAMSNLNGDVMADGTLEKLTEVRTKLMNGTIKVFDCSTFTVTVSADKNQGATVDANGHLTAYMADVNADAANTADTQVVKTENGITYFAESEFRSAPYFNIQIDGIYYLNTKF